MAADSATSFTLEHTPDVEIPEWALEIHFEMAEVTTIVPLPGTILSRVKRDYIPGARRGV